MDDIINLEKKIVPEILVLLEKRYSILKNIYYNQPIGRRALASKLDMGERAVRTEVEVLKEQGLIVVTSMGMTVTEEGKKIIEDLKVFIHRIKGLSDLERALEKELNIERVIVVPGNYDVDELVLNDLGRAGAIFLKKIVSDENIVGITGGSTMAQVAKEMPKSKKENNILVIPARGGLGRDVETQANTVAAKLAQKLGGSYRLLHVPDNIERKALESLLNIPEVNESVEIIKKIDILIFGIGRADVMAERRQLPESTIEELKKRGAVAEAFGHFFDTDGSIVWESPSIGLSLVDFKNINNVVGVAGGGKKAEAIISICSLRRNMVLVIDEGAANRIFELVNKAT